MRGDERRERRIHVTFFEKNLIGGWILRKLAYSHLGTFDGNGRYWDEHELIHAKSERVLKKPEWEWADFLDRQLTWCQEGKLFRAKAHLKHGIDEPRCLRDFNEMQFEPIAAPY
jgi:hypothetical protein